MNIALILIAATKSSSQSGGISFLYFLVPLLLIGYVVFLRPQRQKQRRQQQQMKTISVGDEVVTIGGVVGRVTAMEGDRVWLELDSGVIVEFLRQAVNRRLEANAQQNGPQSDEEDTVDGYDHDADLGLSAESPGTDEDEEEDDAPEQDADDLSDEPEQTLPVEATARRNGAPGNTGGHSTNGAKGDSGGTSPTRPGELAGGGDGSAL